MLTAGRDLADYHAMLAVDIERFTGNNDDEIRVLTSHLPAVLSQAFTRSGLDFSRAKFPLQTGDGYVAGIDYHKLPRLINPLLGQLQSVLAETNAQAKRHDPRIRLRVAVHIGPLPGEANASRPTDIGNGTVMCDVHRLLDAGQVRDALLESDAETTFVAAVISQRAFEDAVISGACGLPPSKFRPISVQVKQFTGEAWLYVPDPSGSVRHGGAIPSADIQRAGSPPGKSDGTPQSVFHIANAGQVANSATGPVTIRQTIYGREHALGTADFTAGGSASDEERS